MDLLEVIWLILLLEKGFIVRCIIRKTSNLRWLKEKNIEIFDCGLFDQRRFAERHLKVRIIFFMLPEL